MSYFDAPFLQKFSEDSKPFLHGTRLWFRLFLFFQILSFKNHELENSIQNRRKVLTPYSIFHIFSEEEDCVADLNKSARVNECVHDKFEDVEKVSENIQEETSLQRQGQQTSFACNHIRHGGRKPTSNFHASFWKDEIVWIRHIWLNWFSIIYSTLGSQLESCNYHAEWRKSCCFFEQVSYSVCLHRQHLFWAVWRKFWERPV